VQAAAVPLRRARGPQQKTTRARQVAALHVQAAQSNERLRVRGPVPDLARQSHRAPEPRFRARVLGALTGQLAHGERDGCVARGDRGRGLGEGKGGGQHSLVVGPLGDAAAGEGHRFLQNLRGFAHHAGQHAERGFQLRPGLGRHHHGHALRLGFRRKQRATLLIRRFGPEQRVAQRLPEHQPPFSAHLIQNAQSFKDFVAALQGRGNAPPALRLALGNPEFAFVHGVVGTRGRETDRGELSEL
jgi:hypothetical protein